MVYALVAVTVLLAAAVAYLVLLAVRKQTLLDAAEARITELEEDLTAALRPPPASSPAERVMRRVVRTAGRVREQGLSGLISGSIEDLRVWADDSPAEIRNIAAADGTVTLFFSDIEDSTGLNARLGDETWVRVLAAHDGIVRARVEKYRGQVVKTAGDGFMVAFRDAEAACLAATAIQRDLRRSLDPLLRVVATVKVRIGIHTGQVISRDGDYFGRNVALAARVGELASGGEVLASSAVHEALDDDAQVELTEVDEVELKGLPGTHVIYRVHYRS